MELIFSVIVGAVIGSFINVVSLRLQKREDFIFGKSCCPHCLHPLGGLDLVPVFSYLFLKGRCRYCKKAIDFRYCFIELVTALSFLLVAILKSPSDFSGYVICSFALLIALVDFDSYEVDLRILLIFSACLLGFSTLSAETIGIALFTACLFYGIVYIVGKWIWKHEAFGVGDIYYLATFGVYFSWEQILFIGLLSFVIGGVVGIVIFLLNKESVRGKMIPFTPFMSISVILTYLFSIQWL